MHDYEHVSRSWGLCKVIFHLFPFSLFLLSKQDLVLNLEITNVMRLADLPSARPYCFIWYFSFFFFFFFLDIFIYISNIIPFPGFLSINSLPHSPSPNFIRVSLLPNQLSFIPPHADIPLHLGGGCPVLAGPRTYLLVGVQQVHSLLHMQLEPGLSSCALFG